MGLVLKEGRTFTPAPEGQFLAVCVDIVDLGLMESTWQGKTRQVQKCRIVFEIAENMEDGRPFMVSGMFTASLGEKANLRKFLEAWRGRAFTKEELEGFDTDVLMGVNAILQIVHVDRNGSTYANINSIMKPMKGMKPLAPSGGYTRVKDREGDDNANAGNGASVRDALADEDDDLPF